MPNTTTTAHNDDDNDDIGSLSISDLRKRWNTIMTSLIETCSIVENEYLQ